MNHENENRGLGSSKNGYTYLGSQSSFWGRQRPPITYQGSKGIYTQW